METAREQFSAGGCASAIVALGGYGRREVFLQSDVDVLLLSKVRSALPNSP